jgi:alcohol dehydrogenase (cytochrome c)
MNGRPCRFTTWPLAGSLALAACLVLLAEAPAHAQERETAPVTDAMLLDPDPADWINWRRTLDGWGFRCWYPVTTLQ